MSNDKSDERLSEPQKSDTAPSAAAPTFPEDPPVGYRRPPVASRFKPGQSGNPRGRPKGKRTVGAILQEVMNRKIAITENGKTRRVSALEGMLHRMRSDALPGDKAALKLLLPLYERYADTMESAQQTDQLLREDREILARYGHLFTQQAAEETLQEGEAGPVAPAPGKVVP
jgi:hypothetical protein